MSTRATIKIIDTDDTVYNIYHHCDGYPEGVGSDLKKYLSEKKHWYGDDIANELVKGKHCGETHDVWSGTVTKGDNGYEITSGQHGDEEYGYLIDCNTKKLTCYKLGWDEFEWKDEKIVEIPD